MNGGGGVLGDGSGTPTQRTGIDPYARLADLGLALPSVAAPLAAYVPAVQSGSHVYVSGQLPLVDGVATLPPAWSGVVPGATTIARPTPPRAP